jgi:predicted transcriptional regulator
MQTPTNGPLTIPPALLAEITAAADEEHRSPSDLVRDALERYMEAREWTKIFVYGDLRAKELGLTEQDVPRLIAESRRERQPGCA